MKLKKMGLSLIGLATTMTLQAQNAGNTKATDQAQITLEVQHYMKLLKCDDGSALSGDFYQLPAYEGLNYDEESDRIVVKTKSNDILLLNTDDMAHAIRIKHPKNPVGYATEKGYLSTRVSIWNGKCSVSFNNFDHQKIWSFDKMPMVFDKIHQQLICSTNKLGKITQGEYTAYDLETGQEKWTVTLPHHFHYPWKDYHIWKKDLPDYDYIITDSLVRLNLKTGETIARPFMGGVKEPAKSRFSLVKNRLPRNREDQMDAAGSGWPLIDDFILTGTHSNMLRLGDSLLIADAQRLYCYDMQLNLHWQTDIPEGCGAKSNLFVQGDTLTLTGYAEAFQKGTYGRYGKPFKMLLNRTTGKVYNTTLPVITKKLTGAVAVRGGSYWQADNHIYYTNDGDTTAVEINWKPKTDRQPKADYPDRVIHPVVYTYKDGKLCPIWSDANQLVVEVYGQDAYLVHRDGTSEMLKAEDILWKMDDNVYLSRKTPENPNSHVVILKKDSQEVEYAFTTTKNIRLLTNDKHQLFLLMESGIAVIH